MSLLASCSLRALHFIYYLAIVAHSCWRQITRTTPQPLHAVRPRIPKHLAILLVTDPGSSLADSEKCLVSSVANAVAWCRAVGVAKLTVYEEHGRLLNCSQHIQGRLMGDHTDIESSDSEIEYPPTPPPSDDSESVPISSQDKTHTVTIKLTEHSARPQLRYDKSGPSRQLNNHDSVSQKSLTLCLTSRKSSKPAIASVARSLASRHNRKSRKNNRYSRHDAFTLTAEVLDSTLETEHNLSSPDFMIVHPLNPSHYNKTPLELHGFLPWHIRLTEIYHDRFQDSHWLYNAKPTSESVPLDEMNFRQALDEFSKAEMRFGK